MDTNQIHPFWFFLSGLWCCCCMWELVWGRWGFPAETCGILFIYILLVMSDKQYQIGLSSRGEITQQQRRSGSLSTTKPRLSNANTPHCRASLNKLFREIMASWDCLLSVDASGYHGCNTSFLLEEQMQCRLVFSKFCKWDCSISQTLATKGEAKITCSYIDFCWSCLRQTKVQQAVCSSITRRNTTIKDRYVHIHYRPKALHSQ